MAESCKVYNFRFWNVFFSIFHSLFRFFIINRIVPVVLREGILFVSLLDRVHIIVIISWLRGLYFCSMSWKIETSFGHLPCCHIRLNQRLWELIARRYFWGSSSLSPFSMITFKFFNNMPILEFLLFNNTLGLVLLFKLNFSMNCRIVRRCLVSFLWSLVSWLLFACRCRV